MPTPTQLQRWHRCLSIGTFPKIGLASDCAPSLYSKESNEKSVRSSAQHCTQTVEIHIAGIDRPTNSWCEGLQGQIWVRVAVSIQFTVGSRLRTRILS